MMIYSIPNRTISVEEYGTKYCRIIHSEPSFQLLNFLHIIFAQLKMFNFDILLNSFHILRLGNDRTTSLYSPPKNNL